MPPLSSDAQEFFEEPLPRLGRNKCKNGASVDQVKGLVGKVERFKRIHHSETGMLQLLCQCLCASLFNHQYANIEARHLHLGI